MKKSIETLKEKTELLIESINNYGKSRNDIAEYLGIKTASINSALSRGGNAELYNKINAYLKYLEVKETEDYNLGAAVRKIEAISTVMLTAIAEVIANQKGQMSSVVKNDLEKMVNEQLTF